MPIIDALWVEALTCWRTYWSLAAAFGRRRVQSSSERVERGCRPIPAQLVHVVEERDVSPESGESAKKHCALPFAAKSVSEGTRVSGLAAPLAPVRGNRFDMEKLGQHGSRGLRTPPWQARIAICRIAH